MNRFLEKSAKAVLIAAVLCLVADGALARRLVERPFRAHGESTVVGPCELGGIPGDLWAGTENATHGGLSETSTCVIVTGGTFPVFTVAARGVVTNARGDETSYTVEGIVTVGEDQCVAESTVTLLGGTSHKGLPFDITGDIHQTAIIPLSAPGDCGTEQTYTETGTVTY